jgi:hypothetical protein
MKKKLQAATSSVVVVALAFVIGISVGTITPLMMTPSQTASAQSFIDQEGTLRPEPKAPMAVSQDGNNVYIVWWTNKSENWEVMFRASNDGGQTFGDKINLSNSTDTESQNAEIITAGNNMVFVSWWETSPETGSSDSVLRVSTDAGQTFGPVIMLGVNGTISTATGNTTETATTMAEGGEGTAGAAGAGGETTEEEAVGGAEVAE